MNGYSTKLHLIAIRKFLEKKDYMVIDALCSRCFDYVAISPQERLTFIYVDLDNWIPDFNFVNNDVEQWRQNHPSFKSIPWRYEIYTVSLKTDSRAKISKVIL